MADEKEILELINLTKRFRYKIYNSVKSHEETPSSHLKKYVRQFKMNYETLQMNYQEIESSSNIRDSIKDQTMVEMTFGMSLTEFWETYAKNRVHYSELEPKIREFFELIGEDPDKAFEEKSVDEANKTPTPAPKPEKKNSSRPPRPERKSESKKTVSKIEGEIVESLTILKNLKELMIVDLDENTKESQMLNDLIENYVNVFDDIQRKSERIQIDENICEKVKNQVVNEVINGMNIKELYFSDYIGQQKINYKQLRKQLKKAALGEVELNEETNPPIEEEPRKKTKSKRESSIGSHVDFEAELEDIERKERKLHDKVKEEQNENKKTKKRSKDRDIKKSGDRNERH